MTPATYSVIRYIADPARNEPLNMGILAWNEIDIELKIHSEAVARIIRSHPHLLKAVSYTHLTLPTILRV